MGFPGSPAGKETACNTGDPSSISGLGRSLGGLGYPLQYSWTSLVAQMVMSLQCGRPRVLSLGWEDPLEEGFLACRIPTDRGAWWARVHGVAKTQT